MTIQPQPADGSDDDEPMASSVEQGQTPLDRGCTLARLYQIENKMDAVVRFELARGIPVLGQ